jgi:hypothetical protein
MRSHKGHFSTILSHTQPHYSISSIIVGPWKFRDFWKKDQCNETILDGLVPRAVLVNRLTFCPFKTPFGTWVKWSLCRLLFASQLISRTKHLDMLTWFLNSIFIMDAKNGHRHDHFNATATAASAVEDPFQKVRTPKTPEKRSNLINSCTILLGGQFATGLCMTLSRAVNCHLIPWPSQHPFFCLPYSRYSTGREAQFHNPCSKLPCQPVLGHPFLWKLLPCAGTAMKWFSVLFLKKRRLHLLWYLAAPENFSSKRPPKLVGWECLHCPIHYNHSETGLSRSSCARSGKTFPSISGENSKWCFLGQDRVRNTKLLLVGPPAKSHHTSLNHQDLGFFFNVATL